MSKLIMAIDDSPFILHLFELLLTNAGYEVSLHTSWQGEASMEFIRKMQPALIITDLILDEVKGISGWRVIEQLRRDTSTARIPVILCTGIEDAAFREIESPTFRILLKPFQITEVLESIQALIEGAGFHSPTLFQAVS